MIGHSKPQIAPRTEPWELTRRLTLGAGAAALAAIAIPLSALAEAPIDQEKLDVFLDLSSVLTGISGDRLAPFADPIDVKSAYFRQMVHEGGAGFEKLLTLATDVSKKRRSNAPDVGDAEAKLKVDLDAQEDTKYLARSLTLLWYLGAWYKPETLKWLVDFEQAGDTANLPAPPPDAAKFAATNALPAGNKWEWAKTSCRPVANEILSATSYTQGWAWRIMGAHPRGASELQFGYWSNQPAPLNLILGVANA